MRPLIASLLLIASPVLLRGQSGDSHSIEIRGHYIGESTVRFLHLESEAREDAEVCRQHPAASFCLHLLGAIDNGERAEISVSVLPDLNSPDAARDPITFVLDGKKVVKITMLVNSVSDAMKMLGPPSSESDAPDKNRAGQKWVDHLTVWENAEVYATLYQDNNPSLEDRRPVLVVESRAEKARAEADATKPTGAR